MTSARRLQETRLLHGDRNTRAEGVPQLDLCLDTETVRLDVIREAQYEVNFVAEEDCVTLPLGLVDLDVAIDSDRVTKQTTLSGALSFHPAGSSTYARTHRRFGDVVVLTAPPEFRAALEAERGSASLDEAVVNLLTPMAVSIAQLGRRYILGEGHITRLAAESLYQLAIACTFDATTGASTTCKYYALSEPRLLEVLDYIETHLAKDIGLRELAVVAGMPQQTFLNSFDARVGMSPAAYLQDRRLTRARDLLEQSAPLSEAAIKTGFASPHHMNKAFHRALGVDSTEYQWMMTS